MNVLGALARDSVYSVVFHLAPRISNALLYIVVGRISGPEQAGAFALSMTYLILFTTVTRGLDDLLVRQIAQEPDSAADYFVSFLSLRLGLSLLLSGTLLGIVQLVFDYRPSTAQLILIMALSVIPENLTYVAQSVLIAGGDFRTPALAIGAANLLKLAGGWVALANGGGPAQVVWIWVIGTYLGMAVLLIAAVRRVGGPSRLRWGGLRLLRRSWQPALAFLSMTSLTTLESQLDTIVLSRVHSEVEVGWYNAATSVTFSLLMFAQAYRFSVYPLMARYAVSRPEKLPGLYQRSLRYLGMAVLPMVVGLVLLAPRIISLIYGPGFEPSAAALRVLASVLFCLFLNVPDARIMFVKDRQRWSVVFLAIALLVNIVLNLLWDGPLGATGASAARLGSSLAFSVLCHVYVTRKLLPSNLGHLLWRTVLAVLVMAGAVALVSRWPLLIIIAVGAVTYAAMLGLLRAIPSDDWQLITNALFSRSKST